MKAKTKKKTSSKHKASTKSKAKARPKASSSGAIVPSTNGSNGRDPRTGKFLKGNSGGPGSPLARTAAKFSALFRSAVSEADIEAIATMLVKAARAGDIMAAREVLNRTAGRPAVDDFGDAPPPSMAAAVHVALTGLGIDRTFTPNQTDDVS